MEFFCQKRQAQLFYLFAFAFTALAFQLWKIQVGEGDWYAAAALEQVSRYISLEEVPRGRIFDRNLIPLTGESVERRIVLFPMLIEDKKLAARSLGAIVGEEPAIMERYLAGGACVLPYRLGEGELRAAGDLQLKGVLVLPVRTRYGEHPLAGQVLGHLGKIGSLTEYDALSQKSKKPYRLDDLVGKAGLELYYEQELKGTRPKAAVRLFYDAAGRIPGDGPELEEDVVDKKRQDLVLTVDAHIQQKVEEIMDRRVAKGAVVVMEAGSGDILALAGRPSYHPGRPEEHLKEGGQDRYFDHCTALYQPGSVFKTVVAAAALEEGLVAPGTVFFCRGENDGLISCWNRPGHGEISFARAFAESCNPVFAHLALELGAPRLIAYARRLGLENQLVIGYPVPRDGRQNLELIGADYNLVNSSVGQGPVLATPVQVASMVNTVASDGVYHPPRLVQALQFDDGRIARRFDPPEGERVLSQATAQTLQKLMELTTKDGVGREAYVPGYGSAGKTGSAQLTGERDRVNAWFAGYAPSANPRYVVSVLVEEGTSGGESAAPVFKEIIEAIIGD
ncbi:MAG: penicillin-binding protein 2 [Firmicutes bacterium]|nr:penicillin-binding protein 2 [Bacillota bacterium]